MNRTPLVILGSARLGGGDTQKLVEELFPKGSVELLDLLEYKIYPYSYTGVYPLDDQFLQVVEAILPRQVIVFATPVYWYAMSGLMKTFFDRLTDIVTIKKELGRKLAGKEAFLVAVDSEEILPLGFEIPFRLTSDYLYIKYRACYYCPTKFISRKSASRNEFIKAVDVASQSNV